MNLQQAYQWIRDYLPEGATCRVQLPGTQAQPPQSQAHESDTLIEIPIFGVSTDSRALQAGELFIALRGMHFDAHHFLVDSPLQRHAAAVVAHHVPTDFSKPALIVSSTLDALGALATGWRRQFTLPVIAVTGSNGKTTVKDMLASILVAAFEEKNCLATQANFNNAIGVPLTLLRLRAAHRAAVVELGMNHVGEIAALAALTQASVALVNNAQREHQEFMHSVAAVAQENGRVISALSADGIAVFPADDAYSDVWRALAGTRQVIDFALHSTAAVTGYARVNPTGIDLKIFTPLGDIECAMHVFGEHNVRNALAATACAIAAGIAPHAIAAGLNKFRAAPGRLQVMPMTRHITLIDDTYNANPDSVRAAIDVLVEHSTQTKGAGLLVLGDMGEVGEQGTAYHREIGAYAKKRGVAALLATGNATREAVSAFGSGAQHFADNDLLIAYTQQCLRPDLTVLVKGSRFMRMERVVQALMQTLMTSDQRTPFSPPEGHGCAL